MRCAMDNELFELRLFYSLQAHRQYSMCVCAYVCVCDSVLSLSTAVRTKIVGDFYHFKWRPQSHNNSKNKAKNDTKNERKSRPSQVGRIKWQFSVLFRSLFSAFSRFTASSATPLHFGAVVVILSKDLHYNLLCENSTHSSIPAPIPIPLHHPLPFRFHFRSILLSFG